MSSLRRRLVFWHSFVFACSLLAFALVTWLGARYILNAEIEHWLAAQAEGLEHFLATEVNIPGEAFTLEEAIEFSGGLPKGSGLQFFRGDGSKLFCRPQDRPLQYSDVPHWTTDYAGVRTRWIGRDITVQGARYRYALWRSYEDVDDTLGHLGKMLALLAPVFLLLSVGGGWWLSGRALHPIDALTNAARATGLHRLSERLPLPATEDELFRMCEAWNEMLARMEDSAGRLKQFTADASHELRTPVAVIRAAAELALRQEREPEAYRTALERIREQSVSMSELIESLLTLARSEGQQIRASFRAVNLVDVVREVHALAATRADSQGLSFEVRYPDHPLTVNGNYDSLRRLVLILVDNALKFTPSPGSVTVRVDDETAGVSLTVIDSGIGIEAEALPRIFDRFYQADASRTGRGAGLGLSLAKWIAASHGGCIDVRSAPGAGSTFRVALPRLAGTNAARAGIAPGP